MHFHSQQPMSGSAIPEIPDYLKDLDNMEEVGAKSPHVYVEKPLAKITRKLVKLVRSADDSKNLRLISECLNGLHQSFVFESEVIYPHKLDRTPVKQHRKKKALTLDEAVALFFDEVIKTFPPIELRVGVSVPTHKVLL